MLINTVLIYLYFDFDCCSIIYHCIIHIVDKKTRIYAINQNQNKRKLFYEESKNMFSVFIFIQVLHLLFHWGRERTYKIEQLITCRYFSLHIDKNEINLSLRRALISYTNVEVQRVLLYSIVPEQSSVALRYKYVHSSVVPGGFK